MLQAARRRRRPYGSFANLFEDHQRGITLPQRQRLTQPFLLRYHGGGCSSGTAAWFAASHPHLVADWGSAMVLFQETHLVAPTGPAHAQVWELWGPFLALPWQAGGARARACERMVDDDA